MDKKKKFEEFLNRVARVKKSELGAPIVSEGKLIKNTRKTPNLGAGQDEFSFIVDVEKDVDGIIMGVLENGIPYLTETGLAKICGVHRKTLYRVNKEWDGRDDNTRTIKIKQILRDTNYNGEHLFISVTKKGIKYKGFIYLTSQSLNLHY